MGIDIENVNIDTSKQQKRTGFADIKHAKIIDAKESIRLKKYLVMKNRKSSITDSNNVFEMYFDQDPGTLENYMFIGRSGLPTRSQRNATYIELSANSDSSKNTVPAADPFINGRITLGLTHDKNSNVVSNFNIEDSSAIGQATGSAIVYMLARGDNGLSGIGYDLTASTANINLYNLARLLYLGATIQPDTTNAYDIGTSALRIKTIYTVNAVDVSSDIRFKKNVKKLKYGLKEAMKIEPISFERDGRKRLGFSAQNLKRIIPEVVSGRQDKIGLSIRPDEIVPVLLNSIKELNGKLDVISRRLSTYENKHERKRKKNV